MDRATGRPSRRPPLAWRLFVGAVTGFLTRLFGWRIDARPPAVLPEPTKPLVVVVNHTSNIDPFLAAHMVWRRLGRWVQPLAKAELLDLPVLGPLARAAGAIPVARTSDEGRDAAYDDAVARLRSGATVYIAPEGTITHDGRLLPLRHGAARLALEADADVLVVTHFGAQRAFSPVARVPQRDVTVTMATDLLSPWPDEDADALTGRIAATMIDRCDELRASYPEQRPDAAWWPPYSSPSSPTATARESLERYRASMAEAVAGARERMTTMSEQHALEERLAEARAAVDRLLHEHHLDERLREALARVDELARVAAEDLAARSRARAEAFAEQARHRLEEMGHRGAGHTESDGDDPTR